MARPREFDQEQVLQNAMLAFWRHGYLGTGMQELVNVTGINRASLYGAFGNKQQLFLAALKRYTGICLRELRQALESGASVDAAIRNMLDFFMDTVLKNARGCLLYNTALEVSTYDREIAREVDSGMRQIEIMLTAKIKTAQNEGELVVGTNPLTLARAVMAAMQSMTVRGSAGGSGEILSSIRDGAMLLFQRQ
ncbi:MAG: TetR/AcrR family transcriptional regulator [SAR324 cluster bacterium]|nr:TetR/AcrR family transcriptional regulator [SAR324 cluster bacterium]